MCRVLEVSRSAYYAWRRRQPSPRAHRNSRLASAIEDAHKRSLRTYGSPRIHAELKASGVACSVNHVAKLMREHGIRAQKRRRFQVTTQANPEHRVGDNVLNRDFTPAGMNRVWCADITYISTREGWLYLAVMLDGGNRQIVGWSMANRITVRLTLEALQMAIERQNPPRGLLHHSDRGSQYTAEAYQRLLVRHGMRCSMSRKGDCWDNAMAESFFGSLKTELVHRCDFATRDDARRAVFEYIEVFYNRQRRHSTLGYLSPVEYAARSGNSAPPTAPLRFQNVKPKPKDSAPSPVGTGET